jgi:hypothetical protein
MAAEDNLVWFNSHKYSNQRNERKKKDQTRTQYIMKFSLKCIHLRYSQPLNNWGWADTLIKMFYTCRTWSLTQNWLLSLSVTKMSGNTLKTNQEWQHTQGEMITGELEELITNDQYWENGEKLDWA